MNLSSVETEHLPVTSSSVETEHLPEHLPDYQREQILKHNVNSSMKGEDRLLLFLAVVMVTVGLNLTFYSSMFSSGRQFSEIQI